jgi:hypothetical protein
LPEITVLRKLAGKRFAGGMTGRAEPQAVGTPQRRSTVSAGTRGHELRLKGAERGIPKLE